MKVKTEKGFINIHIDTVSREIFSSTHPYPTKEEAEKGILIGVGIEKVGCFEIEYTKV